MTDAEEPQAAGPTPRTRWWGRLAIFGLGACLVGFTLWPDYPHRPGVEPRAESANNLRQIGLAMWNYASENGERLPWAVTGKDGRPFLSWRVELLPYLEEEGLYEQFKRDEPWDGPHNKPLLEKMPRVYRTAAGDGMGLTRYRVFVGPGSAFERPGLTLTPADFPDGLGQTLLVVEAGEPVLWTKPEELTYDLAGPLPRMGAGYRKLPEGSGWGQEPRPEINACFGDCSVRFLKGGTDEQILRAVITRNGGEQVDVSKLEE